MHQDATLLAAQLAGFRAAAEASWRDALGPNEPRSIYWLHLRELRKELSGDARPEIQFLRDEAETLWREVELHGVSLWLRHDPTLHAGTAERLYAVLDQLYGDHDIARVQKAVRALATFGGPGESRTPSKAVEEACGPMRHDPRAFSKAIKVMLGRSAADPLRIRVEWAINRLDGDARLYAGNVYRRGKGHALSGERFQKAKAAAEQSLRRDITELRGI